MHERSKAILAAEKRRRAFQEKQAEDAAAKEKAQRKEAEEREKRERENTLIRSQAILDGLTFHMKPPEAADTDTIEIDASPEGMEVTEDQPMTEPSVPEESEKERLSKQLDRAIIEGRKQLDLQLAQMKADREKKELEEQTRRVGPIKVRLRQKTPIVITDSPEFEHVQPAVGPSKGASKSSESYTTAPSETDESTKSKPVGKRRAAKAPMPDTSMPAPMSPPLRPSTESTKSTASAPVALRVSCGR